METDLKKEESKRNKNLKEEIAEAARVRDQAITEEHRLRQYVSKVEVERDTIKKENEILRNSLNELAALYDEVYVAYKDLTTIIGAIKRTGDTNMSNITIKLDAFNRKEGN
jgi:uncharacterized coiled-coil DUF342 family protein